MIWALVNWRRLLGYGAIVAVLLLVGGLYAWGSSQKAACASAEAKVATLELALATAQESIKALEDERSKIERAMFDRDIEKQETQERLRSASAELAKLRRQNAELRDWLDRPIPADVVRLLSEAASGRAGAKAVPAKDAPR